MELTEQEKRDVVTMAREAFPDLVDVGEYDDNYHDRVMLYNTAFGWGMN